MMVSASALALDGGTPVRPVRLPLHKPWFDEREQQAMCDVLAGTHVAGDGAKGPRAGSGCCARRPVYAACWR